MKDIVNKISEGLQLNETRKSSEAVNPFKTKEELMDFIDEIEKTKLFIKKFEDESQTYWKEMKKMQDKVEREMKSLKIPFNDPEYDKKYDELEEKYKVKELLDKASKIMDDPECVKAQDKLYKELAQRGLDSLSAKEQKAIGKRGGRMYNILNEVIKKYMGMDVKRDKL